MSFVLSYNTTHIMVEQGPRGLVESAENMAGSVLETAMLLAQLQSLSRRDHRREDDITKGLGIIIRAINPQSETKIGVHAVNGTGILAVDIAPRAWFQGWKNRERRQFMQQGYTGELRSIPQVRVEETMLFHGFERGDRLGYREALGDKWYLHVGWGTKYLVPVENLTAIELKPIDEGF